MTSRALKGITSAVAVLCGSVAVLGSSPASAQMSTEEAIGKIDRNGDGLINVTEAKQAAAAVIVEIDGDHNGVLTNSELGGRVTVVDRLTPTGHRFMHWKTEGTLTKQEYLDLVESRFKPATPDEDGTLDAAELETEEGKALLQLLQ